MVSVEVSVELAQRLESAAKQAGKTLTEFVSEAPSRVLEDADDFELATERLKEPSRRLTWPEVKRRLRLSA